MRRGSSKGRSPNRKPSGKKDESRRRSPPKRATKGGTAKATGASRASASSTRSKSDAARLAKELAEARARQDATSEILRAISRSSSDAQPVFHAIVLAAVRLLGCDNAYCLRCDATTFSTVAIAGPQGLIEPRSAASLAIDPNTNFPSRAIVSRKNLYLPDWSKIDLPPFERDLQKIRRVNSSLYLPLLRGEECIGVLALASRRADNFDARDIALAESFRDQALIAIENARLFNETKASLERQTAMAQVLEVINSSPGDLKPVFDAILERATRLCGAGFGVLSLYKGDDWHQVVAMLGEPPGFADMYRDPIHLGPETGVGRLLRGESYVQIADAADDDAYRSGHPVRRALVDIAGARTYLAVPIRRDDVMLGSFTIYRREVRLFSSGMIALLQSFAAQAAIAIENARLFNETKEALAHQTATSEVLKAIGSSMADTQPVFERILDSVERLFEVRQCSIILARDEMLHLVARRGLDIEDTDRLFPAPIAATRAGEVIGTGQQTYVASAASPQGSPLMRQVAELMGDYSVVMTPLVWEGQGIGIISAARAPNAVFSEKEMALLRTFADQAVIAIENARLFNETQEALERQTATADILKVIASSPDDVQPVFEAIAERANRLVGGHEATVLRIVGDMFHLAAFTPISEEADAALRASFPMRIEAGVGFESVQRGAISEISDTESESYAHTNSAKLGRARGFRSRLMVPLKSDSGVIGAISATRVKPGRFDPHHVQLLQTFADQAVIAIQNVRLFNELQARTRDLTESLEQQTATAEILSSISGSMHDTKPVFEAIVRNLLRLFGTRFAVVQTLSDGVVEMPAADGEPGFERLTQQYPRPLARDTAGSLAMLEKRTVQFQPVLGNPAAPVGTQGFARSFGFDSVLFTPMLSGDKVVGAIGVARHEAIPFDSKQIALITSFANQAVIAIENTRLLGELRQRTDDLGEALQQQTATADVLKVISRSTFDLEAVLKTLTESAVGLCRAARGAVFLRDGDVLRVRANAGTAQEFIDFLDANPIVPSRQTFTGRTFLSGEITHLPDVLADPEYDFGPAPRIGQYRSALGVPLLRQGRVEGVFSVSRPEPGGFTDREIELIRTFADQAVIAIENVRLFNETQEALERQTATSEILRVISSSSGDLQPVFKAILANALKICGAAFGNLLLFDGTGFEAAELHTAPPAYGDLFRDGRLVPPPSTALGRVIATKRVVHIPDVVAEDGGVEDSPLRVATIRILEARTLLAVPMLRDDELVGAIVIYRQEARPFNDKQIELVTNFADQAVIAIENARLLNELRMRTEELSRSLDDLRAAQDRLVQTEKLASLGQLTAGIAHEIKNPLNFVNNFSALSAELTDELNDLLKGAALTEKMREEVGELTKLLQDNLQKVVQHGQRADSIVKNMLLHSREGSGEQRLADVNALVDESLNLAYHGARAEKFGFNITLQRDFDTGAGTAELFPQEITRALLNLISNGFYAATRRGTENGEAGFEPTLLATTKDLGSAVEIRIRDNGAGIPPEVKEKIFNPFFTTKPAGEGTGLGLSMTHDIIVKQHGGRIEVATEPGEFTEFVIVLPRTANSRKTDRR